MHSLCLESVIHFGAGNWSSGAHCQPPGATWAGALVLSWSCKLHVVLQDEMDGTRLLRHCFSLPTSTQGRMSAGQRVSSPLSEDSKKQ